MVCFGYYKHRWRKRSKNGHFEPKNWSHIFLEADLAKILMDYVLLTLPASLAKIRKRVYFFFFSPWNNWLFHTKVSDRTGPEQYFTKLGSVVQPICYAPGWGRIIGLLALVFFQIHFSFFFCFFFIHFSFLFIFLFPFFFLFHSFFPFIFPFSYLLNIYPHRHSIMNDKATNRIKPW